MLRDVKRLGLDTIRRYDSDVKYADIQTDMEALGKAVMKKVLAALSLAAFCVSMVPAPADAASAITRIKDIAKVQGVRSNQLVGYGLVVGLAKTGDSNKVKETVQSIGNMLKAFGVSIDT